MHIWAGHMTAVTTEINYRLVTSPLSSFWVQLWAPRRAATPRVTMSLLHLQLSGRAVVMASNRLRLRRQFDILATFLPSDLQLHLQRDGSIHFSWCQIASH